MTQEAQHTPGPWHVDEDTVTSIAAEIRGDIVCFSPRKEGWDLSAKYWEANARLIAEAGTVATETGLSPRQLAEQRAKLLEALKAARLPHHECDDRYYSCPKSGDNPNHPDVKRWYCDCGADAHNAMIDAAIAEAEVAA